MKVKMWCLLCLLLPIFLGAQFKSSIDLIGEMAYSNRNLTLGQPISPLVQNLFEKRKNNETGKLNWRVGFNYNRQLGPRIFLKSGLRLASIGFKGEKKTGLQWASQHDGMGGFIDDPTLFNELQFVPDFWFLEIPLVGRFEFTNKKITPFVELGLSPNIYLVTRHKLITDLEDEIIFQRANNHNNLQLVASASMGFNYMVNDQLQLFSQPIFRYHLTTNEDSPIEERLFNYGLEVGLRRELK